MWPISSGIAWKSGLCCNASVLPPSAAGGKPVAVRFTTPSAIRRLLLDPELQLGEAYMDGSLVVEQGSIADLLAILLGQNRTGEPPPWARPQWTLRYLRR